MAEVTKFVYIIDRYLEVSNVYYKRISARSNKEVLNYEQAGIVNSSGDMGMSERIDKLLDLVEKVSIRTSNKSLKITDDTESGQTVVDNKELLSDTKRYQIDLLERLNSTKIAVRTPRNLGKLKEILNLDAEKFLGLFTTPNYAWDILTELASLSVCPDEKTLEARDMIHMHALELQHHIVRVLTLFQSLSPDSIVNFEGKLSLKQLNELAKDGILIDRLIESTIPPEPIKLLKELVSKTSKSKAAKKWIENNQFEVLKLLTQELFEFSDSLEDRDTIEDAYELCDKLVLFGLISAYAAWFIFVVNNREEVGLLRRNMLFCTRVLLDEKRWGICKEFSKFALDITDELNEICKYKSHAGTGMLTVNHFFSSLKSDDDPQRIQEKIRRWETTKLYSKYEFLKYIMLEDFDAAKKLAMDLIKISEEKPRPYLCKQELEEWPILEDFRSSPEGKEVIEKAI